MNGNGASWSKGYRTKGLKTHQGNWDLQAGARKKRPLYKGWYKDQDIKGVQKTKHSDLSSFLWLSKNYWKAEAMSIKGTFCNSSGGHGAPTKRCCHLNGHNLSGLATQPLPLKHSEGNATTPGVPHIPRSKKATTQVRWASPKRTTCWWLEMVSMKR